MPLIRAHARLVILHVTPLPFLLQYIDFHFFIAPPWEPMQGGSRGIRKIKKIITFTTLIEIIFWALLAGAPLGGLLFRDFRFFRYILIYFSKAGILATAHYLSSLALNELSAAYAFSMLA